MKYFCRILFYSMAFVLCAGWHQQISAQGFGRPLTMQGIDAFTGHSASSRAVGGMAFGMGNDLSIMFSNPASLRQLRHPSLSFSGIWQSVDGEQKQQYAPLEYYSNFSLFMEGLTRYIPDPVYDSSVTTYTAADTVQRPFDDIGPNWERSESRTVPLNLFAAVPLPLGDTRLTVGVGVIEYTNLHWYFQNNNVLSPSILTPNPFVASRPANDADSSSVPVQWYQSIQQREGSLQGYGAAIAVALSEKIDLGFSGMIISGSSDDREVRRERGRIRLYQNYFRAESVYYHILRTGTSKYEGEEFAVSGSYQGRSVSIGASLTFPTTIIRTFSGVTTVDTTGSLQTTIVNEKDKMALPFRGRLAMSLFIRENLRLAFEYELRPYGSAEYSPATGTTAKPWQGANVFHIGTEYTPFEGLALRGGVRQQVETFEPEGNPLEGEPVGYTVYSAGAGFDFAGVRLNIGYEYFYMKFVDMWAGAVSINTKQSHAVSADIAYQLPWNF